MAKRVAIMIEQIASSIVAGSRVLITLVTGSAYLNDLPNSPVAADVTNRKYWIYSGRSNPHRSFAFATSAALVSSPKSKSVGSPGAA
jgi:hypothetical protein